MLKQMKKNPGKLFVLSAPSGAGKTTLVLKVIERLKGRYDLKRVITYTSKQPRSGEVSGVDYHFVSESEFVLKIEQDFFVEYSTVYGAYYGVPKEIFSYIDEGGCSIAIVDKAGAASIKSYRKDAVLIWVKPPSKEALAQRLASRARDTKEQIDFRLSLAEEELADQEQDMLFEYVVMNDTLEMAIEQLERIIKSSM